jgi:hypothetical protein
VAAGGGGRAPQRDGFAGGLVAADIAILRDAPPLDAEGRFEPELPGPRGFFLNAFRTWSKLENFVCPHMNPSGWRARL